MVSIGSSSPLSQLFSRLDTKGQGYLEKSDLVSAFSAIGDSDESSIEDVFTALDSDSDGKITESEFSSTLSKLQEALDSEFNQMRMQGMQGAGPQGMAGSMPPPPPPDDEGFTQDELEAQLEEIGDADSDRASLLSDIVENFAAADTDSDGKVSFQEAMAYREQNGSSESTDTTAQSALAAAGMPPPPPPPANDVGFTQDELEAQLEEVGETDSARANLLTDIVNNFDAADTDGDGKVSFKEAMAYREEQSGTATADSSTTTQQAADEEALVMQRIMQLVQAYGRPGESVATSLLSTLA